MYLILEGFDGSGKSSVINGLMEELNRRQIYNFKLVNYMAPAPMWISFENLVGQISKNLSSRVENSIRTFRYKMQFEQFISPYLELGINVLGDRGPASLAYRNGYRLGNVPDSYLDMIFSPDFYFVLNTDPTKCYKRIISTRKLNRVEKKLRDSSDKQVELNEFLSDHADFQLFLEGILPKSRTFYVDNNQSIDETVHNLMELLSNIMKACESPQSSRVIRLPQKISLSNKGATSHRLLADYIGDMNNNNDLVNQLNLSDISMKIDNLKDGAPSVLEDFLIRIINSGRTDIKDIVVDVANEIPHLSRIIASVISKNPGILTKDLLKNILIDEKARSMLVCQLGTNMIDLPSFEEIYSSLASELNMEIAYSIVLYIKGIEKKKSELLSRGSLLFHSDPFVSFFAVQAWISAGLMEYLPPSFIGHNVIEIMHLLQVHNFGKCSQNLVVASDVDNVFVYDIEVGDQESNLEEVLACIASNYNWANAVIWVGGHLSSFDNVFYLTNEQDRWVKKRLEKRLTVALSLPCIIAGSSVAISEFIEQMV